VNISDVNMKSIHNLAYKQMHLTQTKQNHCRDVLHNTTKIALGDDDNTIMFEINLSLLHTFSVSPLSLSLSLPYLNLFPSLAGL